MRLSVQAKGAAYEHNQPVVKTFKEQTNRRPLFFFLVA